MSTLFLVFGPLLYQMSGMGCRIYLALLKTSSTKILVYTFSYEKAVPIVFRSRTKV
jgi:hypothetical protein